VGNRVLVIGIDISKDDFHACIKEKGIDDNVKVKGSSKFTNDGKGYKAFTAWVAKRETENCTTTYVMEATGSYYENLAYELYNLGFTVCVELPNKIKHFSKSLNVKTKTDKVDAGVIAQIGIERPLRAWLPLAPEYRSLRDLCRERLSITQEKSKAKCQLHAMRHSHNKLECVIELKEDQIAFYEASIKKIDKAIKRIVNANSTIKKKVARIEKVKGLGFETIVTVLCETNGFMLFNSIRQVVSYSGLDVQMNDSGKHAGKSRISKKGNARIRQCLYMPALSATQHNERIKDLYGRIVERNPDIKKKGVIAGMRKLLILIFVLWKKNEEYNPNHKWNAKKTSDNEEVKPSFG
jgi:transposase